MPLLLVENPDDAQSILSAISSQFVGAQSIVAISDEEMQTLPFFNEMLLAASIATRIAGADIRQQSDGKTIFACLPIYGDGSATRLLNLVGEDGQDFAVAIIDFRYALECLSHICASPLGRYSPSIEITVALEKLSLSTRIAALCNKAFAHLSLALLSEAQNAIYTISSANHSLKMSTLVSSGFLDDDQVSRILQAAISFQIFHEYGHYLVQHQPDNREIMEQNLTNYIQLYSTRLELRVFHDTQNAKLVKEILGEQEFDFILTSETSQEEYARLIEARLTARQDKEELFCDNWAVQNTARMLVEYSNLGSPDWILVRYTIECLLRMSWSIGSSQQIFSLACGTWNQEANQDLSEEERKEAIEKLQGLLSNRRKLMLSQKLRLTYALEQFDTMMDSLLHSVIQSAANKRDVSCRYSPSSSMARIIHEFSSRHVNQIDQSLYTTDGLWRCFSRGQALHTLLIPGTTQMPGTVGDMFAFYVLGTAFHFEENIA